MRDIERQRHRQREKQASWGEPDVGFNPGTPESCPEPKVNTQPLKHPGIPLSLKKKKKIIYLLMRDIERQRHRQREKQAPCREPKVGLNLGSP